jgi:hypothetical protein
MGEVVAIGVVGAVAGGHRFNPRVWSSRPQQPSCASSLMPAREESFAPRWVGFQHRVLYVQCCGEHGDGLFALAARFGGQPASEHANSDPHDGAQ